MNLGLAKQNMEQNKINIELFQEGIEIMQELLKRHLLLMGELREILGNPPEVRDIEEQIGWSQ